MSDQQKKREQLKQQVLDQIQTQQEAIEALSDEELESIAGGLMMTPGAGYGMNANTGVMMPGVGHGMNADRGAMMPGVGHGMNADRGAMMPGVGQGRGMDHIE